MTRLQGDNEQRSVGNENQMLTAWNIKALSVQVDMILALFNMSGKDLNCSNLGEPAEAVKRSVSLCGQVVRTLMQDSGMLAMVPRSDEPIFLRRPAFATRLSLMNHMIPAEGEVNHNSEEISRSCCSEKS